jgi:hypothetical protein
MITCEQDSKLDEFVNSLIPIYTPNKPDANGKFDCQLKAVHKRGLRFMMRKKILETINALHEQKATDSSE